MYGDCAQCARAGGLSIIPGFLDSDFTDFYPNFRAHHAVATVPPDADLLTRMKPMTYSNPRTSQNPPVAAISRRSMLPGICCMLAMLAIGSRSLGQEKPKEAP